MAFAAARMIKDKKEQAEKDLKKQKKANNIKKDKSKAKLHLSEEQIGDYKEVFQLFDKDQDGILSFSECSMALHTLGLRFTEQKTLRLITSVSEDAEHFTVEFNEFLVMMNKQEEENLDMDALMEAFK